MSALLFCEFPSNDFNDDMCFRILENWLIAVVASPASEHPIVIVFPVIRECPSRVFVFHKTNDLHTSNLYDLVLR